jgi:hypothetical protein
MKFVDEDALDMDLFGRIIERHALQAAWTRLQSQIII